MNFYVYNYYPQNLSLRNVIVLIRDNWDDWFRFETKFNLLYISDLGKYESLGNIKIGQKGMADGQRSPQIPDTFTQLPVDCFSLGQSDYYYDALNQRGDDFRIEILSALRDIAYDNSLYAKVRKLDVTRISLMRDVSDFMIQRQFSRIAKGSARLTKYKIEYTYPQNGEEDPTTLVFSVTPESNPPTNIQVIIGRNNVGKTYLIKNIIKSIYFPDERKKYGRLRSSNDNTGRLVSSRTQAFANILCVSFSPFDNYDEILKLTEKRTATPFRYIGLTSDDLYGTLKRNFVSSLEKCMSSDRKVQLLSNALITLETDPVFERSNIKELLPSDDANNNKKTIEETKKHAEKMTLTRTLTRLIDLLYVKPLRRIVPPQTFRYAACGGLNMALDLSLYFLLYNFVLDKRVVHIDGIVAISPYIAAFLIVFPITFLTGFWMNRHIAFHSSPLRGRVQLFRYLLSVCGSILLNYACLKLFVEVCGFYPTPSKAVTTAVTIVYSYVMQKYFSFRGCTDR